MSGTGWSDTDKLGLLFQIIAKSGPIPWAELTLPEGRTIKACQVMVDKEKQKIKKATLANADPTSDDGDVGGHPTPAATPAKKRKAAATDNSSKKAKKGKKLAVEGDDEEQKPRSELPDRRKKATPKKTLKAESDADGSGADAQAADVNEAGECGEDTMI